MNINHWNGNWSSIRNNRIITIKRPEIKQNIYLVKIKVCVWFEQVLNQAWTKCFITKYVTTKIVRNKQSNTILIKSLLVNVFERKCAFKILLEFSLLSTFLSKTPEILQNFTRFYVHDSNFFCKKWRIFKHLLQIIVNQPTK